MENGERGTGNGEHRTESQNLMQVNLPLKSWVLYILFYFIFAPSLINSSGLTCEIRKLCLEFPLEINSKHVAYFALLISHEK